MICSIFYFLYFAAIGIYVPYWTLYLRHLQFTPMEIAGIYSLPSAMRIFLPPLYGYLADRWQARRAFLIVACAGQILPMILMLYFRSYPGLLLLSAFYALFNNAVLPFTEATVQEEQEKGRLDYGRTRLWGTLSFILLAIVFGFVLDRADQNWILYGILFFFLCLAVASFAMPRGKIHFSFSHEHMREVFANRATWVLLVCSFLMYLSHGSFYGFYSIHLAELGYRDSGIGLHWGVAAGSELAIFYFARRILQRYSARNLLALCCLAAAARWFLTAGTTSFWLLTAIQCLHAFSFGLFHITCMMLVHRVFPEGSRSFGQSLYSSLSSGLGTTVGLLLNGYLWERIGALAFAISGIWMVAAFFLTFLLKEER